MSVIKDFHPPVTKDTTAQESIYEYLVSLVRVLPKPVALFDEQFFYLETSSMWKKLYFIDAEIPYKGGNFNQNIDSLPLGFKEILLSRSFEDTSVSEYFYYSDAKGNKKVLRWRLDLFSPEADQRLILLSIEQVEDQNYDIVKVSEELKEMQEMYHQLSSVTSHQLREPLRVIVNFLQLSYNPLIHENEEFQNLFSKIYNLQNVLNRIYNSSELIVETSYKIKDE